MSISAKPFETDLSCTLTCLSFNPRREPSIWPHAAGSFRAVALDNERIYLRSRR